MKNIIKKSFCLFRVCRRRRLPGFSKKTGARKIAAALSLQRAAKKPRTSALLKTGFGFFLILMAFSSLSENNKSNATNDLDKTYDNQLHDDYDFPNVYDTSECDDLVLKPEDKIVGSEAEARPVPQSRSQKGLLALQKCKNIALRRKEERRQAEKGEQKTGDCEKAEEELKEAESEFKSECRDFAGHMSCVEAVESCLLCPELDPDALPGCAMLSNKSIKCPQLSGEDLEQAKENRDKAQEEAKDLEGSLKELNDDLLEKKGKLADLKVTHEEGLAELKTKHEQAAEDLKAGLKKSKRTIEGAEQKQLAEVQKNLSKALKIQHEFENAISDAHEKLADGEMKLFLSCQSQARKRLALYRKKRRGAILSGRLKKTTMSLLSKNRVSFARKDQQRYESYHSQCVADIQPQKKKLHEIHQKTLHRIGQKKKEYQAEMESLKKSLPALRQQALKAKNEALKDYTETMNTLMRRTEELYGRRMGKTQAEVQKLSQAIQALQQQIAHKRQQIEEQKASHKESAAAYHYLRSKGVKSDSGSDSAGFSGALHAVLGRADALNSAHDSCKCVNLKEARDQKKDLDKAKKKLKKAESQATSDSSEEIKTIKETIDKLESAKTLTTKEKSVCERIDSKLNEESGEFRPGRIQKLRRGSSSGRR